MASTKILSAGSHPTYPPGINNVVSMAIYLPIVKLIVGFLKVLQMVHYFSYYTLMTCRALLTMAPLQ